MIDYGKRNVLGVEIDAVDLEAAVERIRYFIHQRQPYLVTALAVHGVIESTRDPQLRDALNQFDLVLPDGQPVRWFLDRTYGLDLPDKVPGPEVVERLLVDAAESGYAVYFYGSTPETLATIRHKLAASYGTALTVHMRPSAFGPLPAQRLDDIAHEINESGAQVCFVGLGCPRQERFTAAVGPRLQMPALAVGAAFDYLAGSILRAPALVERAGLEWAYRLLQDPRRLARRYLTTNSAYVAKVTTASTRRLLRIDGQSPTPEPLPLDEMDWELVDA